MNYLWFIVVVAGYQAVTKAEYKNLTEDYWVPYTTKVPPNAVAGGKDEHKKILYIARARHTNGALIPGYFHQQSRSVLLAVDNQVHKSKDDIQFLCSTHPNDLTWITTDTNNLRTLTQNNLILGGYEKEGPEGGSPIFVAKKVWNRGTYPGNVGLKPNSLGICFAEDQNTVKCSSALFQVIACSNCRSF